MNHLKQSLHLFTLILIFSITMFSCRKKENRYEGNYIGIERHTYRDSGATSNSLDTLYAQEIQVTYDNAAIPNIKYYSFTHVAGNQNQFTVAKKSIIDGEYREWNSTGYLRFSGDSLYLYSTNFNDQIENWDTETWEFRGKRN